MQATDEQITVVKSLATNPCYLMARDAEALAAVLAELAALREKLAAIEAATRKEIAGPSDSSARYLADLVFEILYPKARTK